MNPQHHILYLKTFPNQGEDDTQTSVSANNDYLSKQQDFADAVKNNTSIVGSYNNVISELSAVLNFNQQIVSKRIGVAQNFSKAIQNEIRQLTFLEQRNLSLNRTLGVSSDEAAGFGQSLDDIAKNLKIGGGQTRTYLQQISKIAPLQSKNILANQQLSEELFAVQRSLVDQLGIAPETANAIQLYGASLEGSTKENVERMFNVASALEEQTGLAGAAKAIFEDIGNLGADIQMQFSRVPGSLEKAVLQARALGTDFNTIAKSGTQLLDIESSINKELEFQLLSGNRLVDAQGNSLTAALREATIRGDAAAATEAMQKIIEQEGETIKTNLFARQELASLLGVSEDKLLKMVQQQELLGDIGGMAENIFTADATLTGPQKSLTESAAAADTRSTEELRGEQTQAQLTEQIAILGDQQDRVSKTTELLTVTMKDSIDAYILSADELVKGGDKLFLLADKLTTLQQPLNELAKVIPGGKIATAFVEKFQQLTGISELNQINATIEGNGTISVGSATINVASSAGSMKDGVISPDGSIITTDPADFLIATKDPSGLASSIQSASPVVASTPGPSAQEIASAVADAIAGIQIVTRIDDINEAQSRNNYNINAIT